MNIEWRRNENHPSCYDMFIDDQYAHAWVQDAGLSWHALQFMHNGSVTARPTKEDAQNYLIAQLVQRRLDGKPNWRTL